MHKILVIEDEKGLRENIQLLLELENFTVITASDGNTGVDMALEQNPDLIICDIMMPGLDGYGVLSKLQSLKETFAIPFIFLTARVEKNDLRKGMQLGADDYLFKPFEYSDLISSIKTRLAKRENLVAAISTDKESRSRYSTSDKIIFRVGDHSIPVTVGNILFISADQQYSEVNTISSKRFVIKRSLTAWEEMLPADIFVRIHRAKIINLNYVNKIQKRGAGGYEIHLNNSELVLEVSRRFYKNLKGKE